MERMTGKQFAIAAKFPERWDESVLRDYIADKLRSQGAVGVRCEVEVLGGRGRADIVVEQPPLVIEVKKYLTREDIFQANGQAAAYQSHLPGKQIRIMGFLPLGENSLTVKAVNAANFVRASGSDVIFLNIEPAWYPARVTEKRSLPTPPLKPSVSTPSFPSLPSFPWKVLAILMAMGFLFGYFAANNSCQQPTTLDKKL